MKDTDLNNGHIVELQDRLHIAVEYLDMALAEHPLVKHVSEYQEAINGVMETLADLYQTVGQMDSVSDIDGGRIKAN